MGVYVAVHGIGVAPQFISHPPDTSGGSRCRADPGRLMDSRVLHIDGRGYHPTLSNGSAQRTHGGGLFLCPRIGADVAARQMVGFPHQPGRGALASRSPTSNRPPLDWLSLLVGLGRTQRFQCKLAQPNRITLAALGELDDLFSNDPFIGSDR